MDRHLIKKNSNTILFYLLVSPFVIVFVGFKLVPFLWGMYLSFTNYNGFNYSRMKTVWFRNYLNLLSDSDAVYSLLNTFKLTGIVLPLTLVAGLALAILLNESFNGIGIYRTIYYVPSVIPVVAQGLMWMNIYNLNEGLLNKILEILKIPPVNWTGYDVIDKSLVLMFLWGAGSSLFINIAAIKNIPIELYEAATIDGVNTLQKIVKITLPLMTPVIFYNTVIGLIYCLQMYIQPILLSGFNHGVVTVPVKPVFTYLNHINQQIFVMQRFSYGISMIWILVIVIIGLTLILFRTSRYWVFYPNDEVD